MLSEPIASGKVSQKNIVPATFARISSIKNPVLQGFDLGIIECK